MNILTIDLEDWFHILDYKETALPNQWENFESRVVRNTEQLLETLGKHSKTATFFCLGWIAKRHSGLIKKISDHGHEIACHSMNHQLVYNQSSSEFNADLKTSLDLLQQITGKKIKTYRAPGFSVTEGMNWFFEILIEHGIENDCSIFPAGRNHGGYKTFPFESPCKVSVGNGVIKEFPLNVGHMAGRKIIFSGGGYFRILPYTFIRRMMMKSEYVMTYFHPRDFDAGQPVLKGLPLKRRLMSYAGLQSSSKKFEKLLHEFQFMTVEQAVDHIDWNDVPVVNEA